MATIVFSSSKGGAGKTTAALTFGFVTSQHGASTTIIDADPNKPIANWADESRKHVPENMKVVSAIGDEQLVDAIDEASLSSKITIVDLEGSKNTQVSVGIGRADLVIIPMMGSRLDVDEALSVIRLIKLQERTFNRTIPYRVLLTRSSSVNDDRHLREIIQHLDSAGVTRLRRRLMERAAYRATFHTGKSLYSLTPKDARNVEAAIENAEAVAAEIREALTEAAAPKGRSPGRSNKQGMKEPAHV